jgi:hypothetical protein
MSSFGSRKYTIYLLLGSKKNIEPWQWNGWQKFFPPLTPLFENNQNGVRVAYVSNPNFGRLSWNERSHQTWPLGAPQFPKGKKAQDFSNVEVWSPTWGECERKKKGPDIFLKIWRLSKGFPVSLAIVIAVADKHPANAMLENGTRELAHIVKPKFFGRLSQRAWTYDGPITPEQDDPDTLPRSLIDSHFLHRGKPKPKRGNKLQLTDYLIEPFETLRY